MFAFPSFPPAPPGELRWGSESHDENSSRVTRYWRHLQCVTPAVLAAAVALHGGSVNDIPGKS